MAADAGGPEVLAVVGAVTGVGSLAWNVWRGVRERARLHVRFYAYEERRPDDEGPAVRVSIVNTGRLPA